MDEVGIPGADSPGVQLPEPFDLGRDLGSASILSEDALGDQPERLAGLDDVRGGPPAPLAVPLASASFARSRPWSEPLPPPRSPLRLLGVRPTPSLALSARARARKEPSPLDPPGPPSRALSPSPAEVGVCVGDGRPAASLRGAESVPDEGEVSAGAGAGFAGAGAGSAGAGVVCEGAGFSGSGAGSAGSGAGSARGGAGSSGSGGASSTSTRGTSIPTFGGGAGAASGALGTVEGT